MQIVSYTNGLGESITSPILAMFMFKGITMYVVLDRCGSPCMITHDQIEGTSWENGA